MTNLLSLDTRFFSDATELAAALNRLQHVAEYNAKYFDQNATKPVVLVVNEAGYSAQLTRATLFQERLTDGSFVYFIRLEG